MKIFGLRRRLFVVTVFLIGWAHTMAQSGPLVPQTKELKTWNSFLLYEVFGKHVNIPVYLNSAENISIQFCWYSTKMVFGERVRTSENPYRIEEGTYINGRLSMYTKEGYSYKLEWSSDGGLIRIRKYSQTTGSEYPIAFHSRQWTTESTTINCPGKGLIVSTHIYMPKGVLSTERYLKPDYKRLVWYEIKNQCLYKITKAKSLERPRGQLAQEWMDRSSEERLVNIMFNGSFHSEKLYDVNDKVSCGAIFSN